MLALCCRSFCPFLAIVVCLPFRMAAAAAPPQQTNHFLIHSLMEELTVSLEDEDNYAVSVAKRKRAMRHLPSLCKSMGPKWTEGEVMRYILASLAEDNEELSLAVVQVIPTLVLPKGASHVTLECALPAILALFGSGSSCVRRAAVMMTVQDFLGLPLSSTGPLKFHSADDVAANFQRFLSFLNGATSNASDKFKLSVEELWLTLCDELVRSPLPAQQSCLPPLLCALCRASPSSVRGVARWWIAISSIQHYCVRACVAEVIPAAISVGLMPTANAATWLTSLCKEEATIAASIDVSEAVLGVLPSTFTLIKAESLPLANSLLEAVLSLHRSPSWQVRYTLYKELNHVAACFFSSGQAVWPESLTAAIHSSVADPEDEVRSCLASNLGAVATQCCATCAPSARTPTLEQLISSVQVLLMDGSERVREAVVRAVQEIAQACKSVGLMDFLNSSVLPMVVDLLHDEAASVHLALVGHLKQFSNYFGCERLQNEVLAVAKQLMQSPKWRVREAFAPLLPQLYVGLIDDDLHSQFQPKLLEVCASALFDRVKSVRDAVMLALVALVDLHSADKRFAFLNDILWPHLQQECHAGRGYLALCTLLNTAARVGIEKLAMMQLLEEHARHAVINVRLAVAKLCGELLKVPPAKQRIHIDSQDKQQLRTLLRTLLEDRDKDVRFFASEALQLCI